MKEKSRAEGREERQKRRKQLEQDREDLLNLDMFIGTFACVFVFPRADRGKALVAKLIELSGIEP